MCYECETEIFKTNNSQPEWSLFIQSILQTAEDYIFGRKHVAIIATVIDDCRDIQRVNARENTRDYVVYELHKLDVCT